MGRCPPRYEAQRPHLNIYGTLGAQYLVYQQSADSQGSAVLFIKI